MYKNKISKNTKEYKKEVKARASETPTLGHQKSAFTYKDMIMLKRRVKKMTGKVYNSEQDFQEQSGRDWHTPKIAVNF